MSYLRSFCVEFIEYSSTTAYALEKTRFGWQFAFKLRIDVGVEIFAYKAKRSTLDAVALVVNSALKALDKGCREYACAFLDYSAVFNTVPRPLLLTKTSACGSPGWVVSWLRDNFTFRTQFVQSDKRKSLILPNDCGVLQGSILSSHLSALHTDDLRSPNDFLLVQYADDVVVGHPLKSQTHLRSLKDGLNHVLAWSEENGLLINNQKSVQCIFRLRPSPNPDSSDILPNEVSSFSGLCKAQETPGRRPKQDLECNHLVHRMARVQ
nr:unnamed protein product [Spirometra erinaceieuropaei]